MVGVVEKVAGGRLLLRQPLRRIVPVWEISPPIGGA
jgi:hypothetical protein